MLSLRKDMIGGSRTIRSLAAAIALTIASAPILIAVGGLAEAAPLPATYTATASGDILTVASTVTGATIAAADLVHSDASVDSASVATPSTATSANLGAQVGPLVVFDSNTETAPPSHTQSGSLLTASGAGVSTGLLNYTDTVNWDSTTACVAAGTPISSAFTQTAGATVDLLPPLFPGLPNIVTTGVSSVTGTTSLESILAANDTRSVVSTTTGSITSLSLLGGLATVNVTSAPVLTATATGLAAPASSVTFTPAAATVTVGSVTTTLVAGVDTTVVLPGVGSVVLHLASSGEVVGASTTTLTTASGDAIVLSVDVNLLVPILGTPLGTVSLDLMPLHADATAPVGGVECDTTAPVVTIVNPADGSTTADTTPPINGTSDVVSGPIVVTLDALAPVTVTTAANGDWFLPVTPLLGNGSHTVTATATDAAGNVGTDTNIFTVAAAAAAISITTPVDGSTIPDNTPAITGTSSVISGTISLVLDGAAPVLVPTNGTGDWTLTTAPLTDGSHVAVATATDGVGGTATDTTTFTVDTTAPVIVIDTPADGSSISDPTPTFSGTSDVISGTITISIDGGLPITVATDGTGAWTNTPVTVLLDGLHSVVATATDAAGNTATDTNAFTVDTINPAISITTPANGSTTTDPTPPITGTSDVISGTISVVVDGGTPVSVATNGTGDWSTTSATLADGSHTVIATATDAAGNTASDTTTFTVDTTAPVIVIDTPADGSSISDPTPTFSGTSDVISGTITISIDGGLPITVATDANGDWTDTPLTFLADGPHSVDATATDAAGNTATATNAFTVDTTTPVITITDPVNGSTITDPTPAIMGISDVISGTIEVSIDGGAPTTVPTDGAGDWTTTTAALADGSHTAVATATDAAGNSATDTTTFTVDTTPPAIAITTPEDGSSTNDPTPPITGTSGVISGTVDVSIDGGPPVTVSTDASGNWALTPTAALADGVHIVDATATDAFGNSATDSSIFLVDTVAPPITITTPADGSTTIDATPPICGTSGVISGSVTVTIDGGTPITVPTDGDGDWCVTPTTALANGAHIVMATAVDEAGNSSTATSRFTVNAPGAASALPFTGVEYGGLLALALLFLLMGLTLRVRAVRR